MGHIIYYSLQSMTSNIAIQAVNLHTPLALSERPLLFFNITYFFYVDLLTKLTILRIISTIPCQYLRMPVPG